MTHAVWRQVFQRHSMWAACLCLLCLPCLLLLLLLLLTLLVTLPPLAVGELLLVLVLVLVLLMLLLLLLQLLLLLLLHLATTTHNRRALLPPQRPCQRPPLVVVQACTGRQASRLGGLWAPACGVDQSEDFVTDVDTQRPLFVWQLRLPLWLWLLLLLLLLLLVLLVLCVVLLLV